MAFCKRCTWQSTSWQIIPQGKYYGIQVVTPLNEKANFIFAHQANSSGERNFAIMMETTTWGNTADSYFSFVEFEDPNLEMSDVDTNIWYIIRSNKAGHEEKCVTDVTNASYSNVKFAIADIQQGDYRQQWKLVKKTTDSADSHFDLVNRLTGNIIQTDYSLDQGYYYTQFTQDRLESNGWQINYIGEKEYAIYGTNSDGLQRFLNATVADEIPEVYNVNNLRYRI